MPRDADEYKEWQAKYEDLEEEWNEEHEGWSNEDKARHLENMRLYNKLYMRHYFLSRQSTCVLMSPTT